MTPLTEEALGKLVPGKSVLRAEVNTAYWPVGELMTFHPQADLTGRWVEVEKADGTRHSMPHPSCFTHIGTLTEDGWIEGEWEANPVGDQDLIEVEYHDGNGETHMTAHEVEWPAVSAFRPAQREAQPARVVGTIGHVSHGRSELSAKIIGALAAQPEPATGGEMETLYEVWQHDELAASSTDLADAVHYARVYGQDGPVELKKATTVRETIVLAALGKTSREVG